MSPYGGYTTGYAATPSVTIVTTRATTWRTLRTVTSSRSTSWSADSSFTQNASVPMVQLRVYAPNGADQGIVPTPNGTTGGYPLNDIPTLTLGYLFAAPRSALLGQPCELAVELSPDKGQTWIEPPNSRFRYMTDGADPLDPTQPSYDITAEGYVGRLSKAVVWPTAAVNADGKRAFLSVTPGVILKTLLIEANGRGTLTGLDHSSFSASADSAGQAWNSTITIYYDPGLDYMTLLRDLADQGFIDFRTRGRSLDVYNANSAIGVDHSLPGVYVILVAGRDITEGPFTRTWENIATDALFLGDGTARLSVNNPAAIQPWGREEISISNGSVSDTGTMTALAQAELSLRNDQRTQYTRGLNFSRAVYFPFWHYNVGDWVPSSISEGVAPVTMRVKQITLAVSDAGVVGGNVILNDRFLEADLRAQRRITGITNGASSGPGTGGGGSGGTDTIAPAKVSGLVGSSLAYDGPGGFPQAQVSLGWGDVVTNADGTAMDDLDHYEVWSRASGTLATASRQVRLVSTPDFDDSPYRTGSTWIFKVRAVDQSGNRGAFSNELIVAMATDGTAPQAPTAPTVTPKLGQLYIAWNGQPSTGSWAPDFDHVEVHCSVINDFTPDATTLSTSLYGARASGTVYTGGTYGVPVYVKLVAVDKSDNRSPASAQGVGTPARLVGSDLDPEAITFDQIAFKDVGNVVADGSFETSDYRTSLAARSHADWQFTTLDRFHGAWSATINAAVTPLTVRSLVLMVDPQNQIIRAGEKLFCRYAYKITGGATGNVQLVVEWSMQDGTTSTTVLASTVKNGVWQQAAGQLLAPTGVQEFRIYLQLDNLANVGSFWVDAIEVRRTIATAIIEDAAITNALIANLAVNDAKIGDLSAGKITAGTLTAVVLMAGTIRTATSGARLEMSGSGMRFYDSTALRMELTAGQSQLRCYSTGDASLTSTGHAFQIGYANGPNTIYDGNEIMARNNGVKSTLAINLSGGDVHLSGLVKTRAFDATHGGVVSDVADSGIYFSTSEVQVVNGSGSSFIPIKASAFPIGSASVIKTNREDFDPFPIIRDAPGERWQYRPGYAEDGVWHYGPMADDLPALARGEGEDVSLDLAALVGVLWEAVRRLIGERDGAQH